jgi:hypothetical protein
MDRINKLTLYIACPLLVAACGDSPSSVSVLPAAQNFQQSPATVNNQLDLLWVVDNSSSMTPLQTDMTDNFNSFIDQFVTKGYDFHLAVTTTDAYLSGAFWDNNASLAKFRDGVGGTLTGVFDILSTTPNLINVFVTNASQGAGGSGDERAFSSLKAALNNPSNAGFLRSNSYMGVVILSDEDDFSDPTRSEYSWLTRGGIADHAYDTVVDGVPANPNLESVDSYVSYLDGLTGTTGATRRYSVSAITVLDNTCLASHIASSPSSIIGLRYLEIAADTNGVTGSICDSSYASTLDAIQQQIIELGTQFYLSRTPIVSTITVDVNSVSVPEDATNGWTYSSTANSIIFHGAAIPSAGATIAVNFQPTGLSN